MPRAARTPKRSYHHGDLRRALLDAALAILEAEGPQALTLREVARRVGVSQAAPYHHFADKEAILAAVAEEGFAELYAAMTEARDAAGPKPAARFHAMGAEYVAFAVQHPAHFRVMFVKFVDISRYPSLHEVSGRTFTALLDVIGEGQKAGVIRRGNPAEIALLVWSTVHGLSMLWIDGAAEGAAGAVGSLASLSDAAGEMLLRGVAR